MYRLCQNELRTATLCYRSRLGDHVSLYRAFDAINHTILLSILHYSVAHDAVGGILMTYQIGREIV